MTVHNIYKHEVKKDGRPATVEDPQDVLLREARAEQNKIKADGPDQVRWKIPIYSTSTKKPDLEMLITKSTKFSMRLEPARGFLYFSLPEFQSRIQNRQAKHPRQSLPKVQLPDCRRFGQARGDTEKLSAAPV